MGRGDKYVFRRAERPSREDDEMKGSLGKLRVILSLETG
jgi:hypothetical protein